MISLPLQSERLRIRLFEPDRDAALLHELWGDPEAMQFIPGGARASIEETRSRIATLPEGVVQDGWGFWALAERESDELVGAVGLFPLAWEGPEIELAYHIVPSAWGRGYATEAGGALLSAAWGVGLDHVVAIAMPGNGASRRVMEKLGMEYEGPAQYRDFEVVRYSISRPA